MSLTIPAPEFDLEKTLNSGQVFHWESLDDGFCGLIGDRPVSLKQKDGMLVMEGGAPATLPGSSELARPLKELVMRYFALDNQ